MRLKLLIIICNDDKEKQLKKIYHKYNVFLKLITHGSGTASPSILDYFGLVETKKQIHLSLIPDTVELNILNSIKKMLHVESHGTAIAFTIPLSSANKYLLDNYKNNSKKEDQVMNSNEKFHLVITIVLEGYLDKVMEAAKKAGAQGGTVISGRGLGGSEAVKVFGFEIEPGRELVLNIVNEKIKNKVMEEITASVGIKTEGRGICIALPIDNAIGLK